MEIHSPDPEALASEGLQGDELVEPYSALDRTDVWGRRSSNETRDALLRRMLAASDILAVLFGGFSVGFLFGNNISALFWTITLTPLWVVLAKLVGLYDRDQRSLRHLTIDEAAPLGA